MVRPTWFSELIGCQASDFRKPQQALSLRNRGRLGDLAHVRPPAMARRVLRPYSLFRDRTSMRPLVRYATLLLLIGTASCGSWRRVGEEDRAASSSETLTRLFNVQAYYQSLGRLAAGEPLPFVGSVAFARGPGDSTIALVALSLENRSLSF